MQNKLPSKSTMGRFFSMLWKARLPYDWILGHIAVNIVLTNAGVSTTEYTAELYAGNVDLMGVVRPFLVVSLVSLVISSILEILGGLCMARIGRNLRRAVWENVVHMPFGYYQQNAPKELIFRFFITLWLPQAMAFWHMVVLNLDRTVLRYCCGIVRWDTRCMIAEIPA